MKNSAKSNQQGDLTDFQWDNEESFFGIEPVNPSNSEDPLGDDSEEEGGEEKEKSASSTEKGTKPAEEKPEVVQVPFDQTIEEEENNLSEEEEVNIFTTLASDLAERKIFRNIEIKEGQKINEEQFFELQNAELESRVEEAIEELIAEIGSEGAEYIKAVKAGASREFFQAMSHAAQIPEFKKDDEKTHDAFLRYYYRNVEGLDEEDIADKLEWLSEHDKKAKYAEKYHEQVTKAETKRQEQIIKDAEARSAAKLQEHKDFVKAINTTLLKTDKIGSFNLSKTDKATLTSFITEPVKLNNGKFATGLQIAVNKVMNQEDKSQLLLLAKILKSNFDFSDIVVEAQTTVTRNTKKELANQKLGAKPTSSPSRRKSLSDYFN